MATYLKNVMGSGCASCGSDPCGCPAPSIVSRKSDAGLSKCGWPQYNWSSIYPSPYKIYRTKALSGSAYWQEDCVTCSERHNFTVSGYCEYNRPCTGSTYPDISTGTLTEDIYQSSCTAHTGPFSSSTCNADTGVESNEAFTSTQRSLTGKGCVSGSPNRLNSGTTYENLSNEYTTAQLSSDVDAALPAFSGAFSSGFYSAYYILQAQEESIQKRKTQYKFILPSLTGYSCYKISWSEGGVAKSYTWNGTDTETPVYTVLPPSTPGTINITGITVSCIC